MFSEHKNIDTFNVSKGAWEAGGMDLERKVEIDVSCGQN